MPLDHNHVASAEISDIWIKLDWNRTVFRGLMKEYESQQSRRHESKKFIPAGQMSYCIKSIKFK
ncbi:hypothetical protein EWB00_001883 [Schistosoma japonicum]|uniref:Uncharacterized protein n=1 Tax=Schistosoma japonicum TaxID=6182 RepID=A0A4Z2DDW2_SCHJA|nr:hypothetical protein EWB00_001883 [Schistosoma japonicum]TNN14698.1 hypothetical protein EWB00_001883 [Schistosoma japonicum]TNN14699.1 hypothetical protein EWB00_001883 [Schistosoma japonicum]